MAIQVLRIKPGSDGDGRKWPKHHYIKNDAYFLDRVAGMWIKDLPGGPQSGLTYRLDQLPQGYAGFEKARADTKHVDRYIYGHPNGQFRSLNEFYPHFKHLMDHGGSAGCGCIKCAGTVKKTTKELPDRRSKYFAESSNSDGQLPRGALISPLRVADTFKKGQYSSDEDMAPVRRDKDVEDTPDLYEKFIQRLKHAGPGVRLDEKTQEPMSPDWRAADAKVTETLRAMRDLPSFAPRIGEIVLFVRKLDEDERVAWDKGTGTFRRVDSETLTWREAPKWEAGVVTQMPREIISEQDLMTDAHKQENIIYSGFKIEPLSEPGNEVKPYSRQYKNVPLHAIRPFALWQDCLRGIPEKEWHPTVKHALMVASSVCIVSRYRITGEWPSATVFCRGLYLGPELLMLGDVVQLLPRSGEQRLNTITDVMIITSIRLRFVNLDFDEDDLAPSAPALSYQTSLHITGKVFTTDPSRSFKGVSKTPIDPGVGSIPRELEKYGPWYHYTDPNDPAARVEIPSSRIAGRCHEHCAMNTIFTTPSEVKTEMQPLGFKAVNGSGASNSAVTTGGLLSRGLTAIKEARAYSQVHDSRLTNTDQQWFLADTRIEQLDLHEVNGRFVGGKDPLRTSEQLNQWRRALKALNGKKGAAEEYEAARKQQLDDERAVLQNTGGMMGSAALDSEMVSSVNGASGEGEEEDEDGDEDSEAVHEGMEEEEEDGMDVDELGGEVGFGSGSGPAPLSSGRGDSARAGRVTIDLMDSESEEDQLVGELLKNIRPGGSRG